MDSPGTSKKLSSRIAEAAPRFLFGFALLAAVGAGVFWFAKGKGGKALVHAYHSFWDRWADLQKIDEQNHRLVAENQQLRAWLQETQTQCAAGEFKKQTSNLGRKALRETGMKVGRALATIDFQIPASLQPTQLHTLAVSYFRADDFEKSAVILGHLTHLETGQYRSAQDLVMTGVSFYKIDLVNLAREYFEQVVKLKPESRVLPYQAQARLWMALSYKKQGEPKKAQFWLGSLMDHHPHSKEAAWVNSKEGQRAVASAAAHEEKTEEKPAKPVTRAPAEKEHKDKEEPHHAPAAHEAAHH
jgi:tetratricopeptide (TPR) repeat protein